MRVISLMIVICWALRAVGQPYSVSSVPPRYVNGDSVFSMIEEMPSYPGGEGALMQFIQNTINYPDYERENDIQGRVVVGFVVNEDGSLSDIRILKSVSHGIDSESLRVVRLFPHFIPGRHNSKAVKVDYGFPINFKLATDTDLSQTEVRSHPVPPPPPPPGRSEDVYTPPALNGGDDALMTYISAKALRYSKKGQEVTRVFMVQIDERGAVKEVGVYTGVEDSYTKKARTIIQSLPRFTPATRNGEPVPSLYMIPVWFKR